MALNRKFEVFQPIELNATMAVWESHVSVELDAVASSWAPRTAVMMMSRPAVSGLLVTSASALARIRLVTRMMPLAP